MDGPEGPLAEADPSSVDDDPTEVGDRPAAADDHTVRYSLAWWLSFAVPISIAMVAVMGAVVGYRAEYHASVSSALESDAEVSSTYASGHLYDALLTGQLVESEHDLWEELAGARGQGTGPAMVAAADPACAADGTAAASVATANRTVDCRLAQVFSAFALPAYWAHGNPADFDLQRFVADWVALGSLGRDVAVRQHEAAADAQRHRELRLLWLAFLLALALALCTLAQAALHHRWSRRPSRAALALAVPGWALLAACGAVFLVWEL